MMAGKLVGQPTAAGTPTVSNLHLFGSLEKCTLSPVFKTGERQIMGHLQKTLVQAPLIYRLELGVVTFPSFGDASVGGLDTTQSSASFWFDLHFLCV